MGKKPAEKAKEIEKKAAAKAAPEKKVKAKGTTEAHAEGAEAKPKKKAHAAEAKTKDKPAEKHCQIKSCKREYRAKGYCRVHYKKWRHGEYGVARYKTCKDMDCRKSMARTVTAIAKIISRIIT